MNRNVTSVLLPLLLALCVCGVALCGCRPYTTIGGRVTFPADSGNNNKAKLNIVVNGARGRAYVEETEKEVFITLTGGKHVVRRQLTVVASGLDWEVTWDELADVTIKFVDWGPSISETDAKKENPDAVPRVVKVLRFILDPDSGEFVEEAVEGSGVGVTEEEHESPECEDYIAEQPNGYEMGLAAGDEEIWSAANVPIRAGRYEISFTATAGAKKGTSTQGYLYLHISSVMDRSQETGEGPTQMGTDHFPLWGWTDVDLNEVNAPVGDDPSPGSQDPIYPGVLVSNHIKSCYQGRLFVQIAASKQTRNFSLKSLMADGAGIFLSVDEVSPDGFAGRWDVAGRAFVGDGSGTYRARWVEVR